MKSRELLRFAQDASPEGQARFAAAIARFFSDPHLTESEEARGSGLVLELIRQAELDLRRALAERLAGEPGIPNEIVIFLANDAISVADAVLRRSPVLKDLDLAYIIAAQGAGHWRAIAARAGLGPMVVERLINTDDAETLLSLAGNDRITLHQGSLKKLIRRSLTHDALQVPLLRRPEIDADLAADLYLCVAQALKDELTQRFPLAARSAAGACDALAAELTQEAAGDAPDPKTLAALAQRLAEDNRITGALLVNTLRRGQTAFFTALFAARAQIPAEQARRLIVRDGGRGLALACRAFGLMKSEFASLFLLTASFRTSGGAVPAEELAAAIRAFDAARPADVARCMERWAADPASI